MEIEKISPVAQLVSAWYLYDSKSNTLASTSNAEVASSSLAWRIHFENEK
jgi:hypothetical protein